jgi:hypothetical protein
MARGLGWVDEAIGSYESRRPIVCGRRLCDNEVHGSPLRARVGAQTAVCLRSEYALWGGVGPPLPIPLFVSAHCRAGESRLAQCSSWPDTLPCISFAQFLAVPCIRPYTLQNGALF